MPEWRAKDDSGFLATLDVEALIRRELSIKAGRVATATSLSAFDRKTIAPPYRQCESRVYYTWSDSSYGEAYVSGNNLFGDEEELKLLYAEFEEEAVALANEGLAEFRQVMSEHDRE